MYIVCSDLEGVFVSEIWINVAEKTGIKELRLTTRDISDYDVLMKKRLSILHANRLKIQDIQEVIAGMEPLEGAVEFLDWLRSVTQVVIVSDTFIQFAEPLMLKLGRPTLLCHSLTIDADGSVSGYNLRQKDGKKKIVQAFKGLNYNVIACGDSYNDIDMLQKADKGMLFNPPDNVKNEYPELSVSYTYKEMKKIITGIMEEDGRPKAS
ncbi:phosphoserine / homoserine phosphotransferase [Desulfosarcina sp. BuS5]|uniref:bifunctional phosphoserine phosphatase/homoserine phosphotransferase ThrH n=1 Tax=Desulfosarcina sp. BuS5 TaxID=933262 RepID=UPI00048981CA|nr:bifunctional phosphoserine phosphatase/homoserine phosphotransferase ThrH [Desulfosarcina sp. BuS5]WDN88454.1 phosphoserine / homoserine phosphotransferase [Desulfosarcina sp. BuS5]